MSDDLTPNAKASYIEGLKYELSGAIQHGDKDHEKAVRAELDRVAGKREAEKAVAPKPEEKRAKTTAKKA